MKALRDIAPALLLIALSATQIISAGEFLTVINPIFSNVPVACSGGYVYQVFEGGTCSEQYPEQPLNGVAGIGWAFTEPVFSIDEGSGLTIANSAFNPPSFTGLPFSTVAFLRGPDSEVAQTIFGFVAGAPYRLYFYLGSRYASGQYDGNQTVAVLIDNQVVGSWSLVSYTPFALQTRLIEVTTSGPHVLRFVGLNAGDHTAFFSGVTIKTVGTADQQ